MTNEILTSENLIEIHEKLNDFAKHHYNKGGQQAHIIIKAMWDESRKKIRDGSKEGIARNDGFDQTFEIILKELRKNFIP